MRQAKSIRCCSGNDRIVAQIAALAIFERLLSNVEHNVVEFRVLWKVTVAVPGTIVRKLVRDTPTESFQLCHLLLLIGWFPFFFLIVFRDPTAEILRGPVAEAIGVVTWGSIGDCFRRTGVVVAEGVRQILDLFEAEVHFGIISQDNIVGRFGCALKCCMRLQEEVLKTIRAIWERDHVVHEQAWFHIAIENTSIAVRHLVVWSKESSVVSLTHNNNRHMKRSVLVEG